MLTNDVLFCGWCEAIDDRLLRVEGWRQPRRAVSNGEKDAAPVSALEESCRYVSQGGGKRLRGLLACGIAHDLGGEEPSCAERALSAAVALELLHAASLVHDDLPALDNDDIRRGRASCHKAFGEATAILTGDALIGAAFVVVTSDAGLSSDTQARVVRILSHAWWDLCLGQQLDIDQQKGAASPSRAEMIRLKTGALFGASAGCGAVCAGIREAVVEDYVTWGTRVGECFQALDDLEDGERLPEERDAVMRECLAVLQSTHDLDARLARGVTHQILVRIFGGSDEGAK